MHYDEVMNNKSGGEGGQGEGSRGLMSTVDVIIVPLSKKCAFGGQAVVVVSSILLVLCPLTPLFFSSFADVVHTGQLSKIFNLIRRCKKIMYVETNEECWLLKMHPMHHRRVVG